jgi:hypothetical protein
MSKQSNREYYTARVNTERALAAEAKDATIAALHAELANRYAQLLADLDEEPTRQTLHVANG